MANGGQDTPGRDRLVEAGPSVDTEKREQLAAVLAAGCSSVAEAARASGYSRRHVSRLLESGELAAEVEERRSALEQALGLDFEAELEKALSVLRSIAADSETKSRVRVAASRVLVTFYGQRVASKKPSPAAPR